MQQNDFYVFLPSNVSSAKQSESNAASDYVTFIERSTMNLGEGKWEVALVNLLYPKTTYNVTDEMTDIKVKRERENEDVKKATCSIKPGFYSTATELIHAIDDSFPSFFGSRLVYDNINSKVTVYMKHKETLIFTEKLAEMLGLLDKYILYGGNPPYNRIIPTQIVDVYNPAYLFIYCDIVHDTLVGNKYVPLLAVCKLDYKILENIVEREIHRPNYMKLRTNNFTSMRIIVTDSTGNRMKFLAGKIICTLHFRKYE